MIRVIFNDGIMERRPLEVLELPAYEKLSSQLWRLINDRAMCMAFREADTGIVNVYVCRVKDEEEPWYREDLICTPYGECICEGLASQRMNGITMEWWLPGRRPWTYRTANTKPEEDGYHD